METLETRFKGWTLGELRFDEAFNGGGMLIECPEQAPLVATFLIADSGTVTFNETFPEKMLERLSKRVLKERQIRINKKSRERKKRKFTNTEGFQRIA